MTITFTIADCCAKDLRKLSKILLVDFPNIQEATKQPNSPKEKAVKKFLTQCCIVCAESKISAARLYDAWLDWADGKDVPGIPSSIGFAKVLSTFGFGYSRDSNRRFWHGLRLA